MRPIWTAELKEWISAQAAAAGFERSGMAPAFAPDEPAGRATAQNFARWLAEGRAGEMEYLKRRDAAGALLRESARTALPWARSVIVCAISYNIAASDGTGLDKTGADRTGTDKAGPDKTGPRSINPAEATAGWIARYAWSAGPSGAPLDYHDDLLGRLRGVEAALAARTGCVSKSFVDTGPLLERDFAARAGVGWIGRNTCVIDQRLGSWLLLGVIVTSLDLPGPLVHALAPDRCGTCTRCIDACPTAALLPAAAGEPRAMDASRCIAYLTIEKKGSIAEDLRAAMGRQVFGCDICQDVCPWNRRAPAGEAWQRREELVNPSLTWLAELGQEGFRTEFRGSPLERTKRHRLERNVAIAMGNSGQAEYRSQLERWAAGADEVLAETAGWALGRLEAAAALLASPEGSHGAHVDDREQGAGADRVRTGGERGGQPDLRAPD